MIKTFKIPNKYGQGEVEIKRYIIDNESIPTAIIFGKFSPWTNKRGHGKLVDFAKQYFDKIAIVSPTRSGKDKDVDIFTDEQKEQIINIAEPNIPFHRVKSNIPIRMFTEVVNLGYDRPVLIVGKDREKDFNKYFIEYNENNKPVTDMDDPNFGKGEFMVVPRVEGDTSATMVRKALKDGNKNEFLRLTGYSEQMYKLMLNMIKDNINEGFHSKFHKFYF